MLTPLPLLITECRLKSKLYGMLATNQGLSGRGMKIFLISCESRKAEECFGERRAYLWKRNQSRAYDGNVN